MLIRYNKFDDATRDRIRALESKGHIGYIRYLLMRRWPLAKINAELMKLGLSWAEENDLFMYFRNVLFPIIAQHKLESYYKAYRERKSIETLSFQSTFQRSEIDRQHFCGCIKEMEIDFFFANEVVKHYGSRENIPLSDETKQPIITVEASGDFVELLNHPKRPLIESMLVDGKTPRMISDYLDKHYDIQLAGKEIAMFSNAFFKTKRRDLERTIDDLQDEVKKLEESIYVIREIGESQMTIGEKSAAIANAKIKIEQLKSTIQRLMGHHSHAAYNAGILEFAQIREMFADVMYRSHRRFVDMDIRTEDEVVPLLGSVVTTMARATDKILVLDEKLGETTKKTVSEEMLEVITPTLDRVLEEEKEAFAKYQKEFGGGSSPLEALEEENPEILGTDD